MQRLSAFSNFFAVILSICRVAADSAPGFWSDQFPMPPGANGAVTVMTNINGVLYVGGSFTEIAGIPAKRLAKFDGTTWSEVGGGLSGTNAPAVFALAHDGTNLYVGGRFGHAGAVVVNNIAKWSDNHWEALESGVTQAGPVPYRPATVGALLLDGTNLFVSGSFTLAGTNQSPNIARWDGKWHGLAGGAFVPIEVDEGVQPDGFVTTMCTDGTNLYIGGEFVVAGGVSATNVAKWDGQAWHSFGDTSEGDRAFLFEGERLSGLISAMLWHDNSLLMAGDFRKVNGIAITNLARWDGANWQSWFPVSGDVRRLVEIGGDVAVLGIFDSIGGVATTNVAFLHNGQWQAKDFLTPERSAVSALELFNGELWLGGNFSALGFDAGNIVHQVNGAWQPIVPGRGNAISGVVTDIASHGLNVWVSGALASIGGKPLATLATWDGNKWAGIDFPFEATVTRIKWIGTNLYAAGFFKIPELGATNLLRWDGQSWSAVGGPQDQVESVRALETDGTNLFVFGTALGADSSLRWWDGAAWHMIPRVSGFDFQPRLTALDGHVYLATVDLSIDPPVAEISKINIETSSLEPMRNVPIRRLGAFGGAGTNLWVFGWDDLNLPKLYRQADDDWEEIKGALQPGQSIAVIKGSGKHLVFSGPFSKIGGVPANGLAEWTGSGFRSVGVGILELDSPGEARAIEFVGEQMFVSGSFTKAGPFSAGSFSIWTFRPDVRLRLGFGAAPRVVVEGPVGEQVEIEATDDLGNWGKVVDLNLTGETTDFVDRRSMGSGSHFYRVKRPQQ